MSIEMETCNDCGGAGGFMGAADNMDMSECLTCNGTGKTPPRKVKEGDLINVHPTPESLQCESCGGSGVWVYGSQRGQCVDCNGTGYQGVFKHTAEPKAAGRFDAVDTELGRVIMDTHYNGSTGLGFVAILEADEYECFLLTALNAHAATCEDLPL